MIWIAVKDEYAYMLADDVYDAFLLVPLYLGMYFKEDVHIHGAASKRLCKNAAHYVQRILHDYSDKLSQVNITVDDFKDADGEPELIGAGLSCGVDSLSTVYDWFVNEDDPDYRINMLFFFNTGWHGDYYDEKAKVLCERRFVMNKAAAGELGLSLCWVASNFHAFTHKEPIVECGGYLSNYSCVLGLQRGVKRYYVASSYSYNEMHMFDRRGGDMSAFCESYMIPLFSTRKIELVIDGCQYERGVKTAKLADWAFARKHLNPCSVHSQDSDNPHNCSKCGKCLRTMLTLEILGKLDDFSGVFDIETYRKHEFPYKCDTVLNRKKDAHKLENYALAQKYNPHVLPSILSVNMYFFPKKCISLAKKVFRKILGDTIYDSLKRTLRRR